MKSLFKRGAAGFLAALIAVLTFGQVGTAVAQPALRQLIQTQARVQPDAALTTPDRFVLPRGRMGIMTKNSVGNASYDRNLTQLITRTRAIAPVYVKVVFGNLGMDNEYNTLPLGEQCGPAAITIRSAAERLGTTNTLQKFTFKGADSVTLQPCEMVESDPLDATAWGLAAGAPWPSNTYFSIRTETVTPSLGGIWPQGLIGGQSTVNTGGVTGTRADQSLSCTAAVCGDQVYTVGAYTTTGGATNMSGHVPMAMVGFYAANVVGPAAPLWVGDSIFDNAYPTVNNYFGAGGVAPEKAVRSAQLPFSRYALGSMRASFYEGRNDGLKYLMRYASQLYWEAGTNGLNAGSVTASELDGVLRTAARDFRLRGGKDFIVMPLIPSTASSDGGTSNASQAYRAGFEPLGQRDVYIAFERAGVGKPDGYTAFVDHSKPVEDPTDSSKFLSNGTANYTAAPNDGNVLIHPNETGHTLMTPPILTDMQSRTLH